MPVNEAQVRPLTKLKESKQQVEAWEMAVKTAPDGKITAKHVASVVAEMYPEVGVRKRREPDPPELGMVTFIDPKHVKPRMIRSRPTWGHSYFEAGFTHVGYTKGGLWAFQMLPTEMPEAVELQDAQMRLVMES